MYPTALFLSHKLLIFYLPCRMFQLHLLLQHVQMGKLGLVPVHLVRLNVQLVMEELGGGGHLTNAACQLDVEQ